MNRDTENNDWLPVPSKSHPGRFYLFNKSTGETQWLPSKQGGEGTDHEINTPSPKLTSTKSSKTPAQDRLKRLQHNLKKKQLKDNDRDTKPTTSEKKRTKLINETVVSSTAGSAYKADTVGAGLKKRQNFLNSTVPESPKKVRILDRLQHTSPASTINPPSVLETCTEAVPLSIQSNDQNVTENSKNIDDISRHPSILKTVKDNIYKIPLNISRKLSDVNLFGGNAKSYNLRNCTKFKATKKTKAKQSLTKSGTGEAITKQAKDTRYRSIEEDKTLTDSLELNNSQNLNIPCYPRGSANFRLQRLKESFISQQQKEEQACSTKNKRITNNNELSSLPVEITPLINHNAALNSSHNTATDSTTDEIEAMDWLPILSNEETTENTFSETTLAVKKSQKFALHEINEENQTIGDIIDTVTENLLRLSAEKQRDLSDNKKKWRKDFYYFIVDTNVLLRNLTFVEDLTKMKLCDTKGSMLYLPYSVLQELDKLKMRSGSQEGVKTLAVRAIKYLNSKLENNSPNVQAQSALEERNRLIDVDSADDCIINCCLQAKKHLSNLVLLTEDVNLRNKAICNNIMVSTKSDLMAKRYDSIDKS